MELTGPAAHLAGKDVHGGVPLGAQDRVLPCTLDATHVGPRLDRAYEPGEVDA